ncbi:hypothetical protein SDC9_07649 [bioreactor metagenome]|uniref:Uncharacterized protein n=1 Tax=bioreactor metagenome TaxID=1076179 RepID=A0A644T776_9ZZZZ|nr:hypothetical protein [Methanobrevibacter sp.]MEA4956516.1 hypothetical protein [Methanobrevibacter sp.]
MDALEALAILILAGAIIVLLYYYLQNNAEAMGKVKEYIPSNIQNKNEGEQVPTGGVNMAQNANSDSNTSMGEKLKVKFKDIDMPNISTDSFSKKIDSFLDEKSDELIKDWSLATKEDINVLEKRYELVSMGVDELTKRFNEYREFTNERLESIDKRLNKLEDEE